MTGRARSLAVIGGGWAGIAAAVGATRRGDAVTLFEMAPQLGGRARSVVHDGLTLDNGQHILIGAYRATLALLRELDVDLPSTLLRMPLRLAHPDGSGLNLRAGSPSLAFAGAVLRNAKWRAADRVALLAAATRWRLSGFRCDPARTVADLTARLPHAIRRELIDPLCVAALNTPAEAASAEVFLRVLRDGLFSGPGSADLLLPRVGLSELLPTQAETWLTKAGARIRLRHRVETIRAHGDRWRLDDEHFDRVMLAAPPGEAARLAADTNPDWSRRAAALRFEPIVTVYMMSKGTRLAVPMYALTGDATQPAQFVFDRGQLGGPEGLLAFVISGAQEWVDRGLEATTLATLAQAESALKSQLSSPLKIVHAIAEKRATFACTPQLDRPPAAIARGIAAAGDWIDGPYPATLEGAVVSGVRALDLLL